MVFKNAKWLCRVWWMTATGLAAWGLASLVIPWARSVPMVGPWFGS